MKSIKDLFTLPVFINVLIGVAICIGLVLGLQSYLKVYTKHNQTIEIPDISKMKLFNALEVLKKAGLKYEIDSFKFDEKFDPYHIFDVYPAIGSDVKTGRRIFIRANPKTWAPVAVPNLKDMYKNTAFRSLEYAHLQMGDTIYQPHKYKDLVLRMMYNNREIKGGELVPYMSKIDLVIGISLQKNIPMIDVTGMAFEDAKQMLEANLFEVGLVDRRDVNPPDSDNVYVFYQSPSAGEIFDQGEAVILFLTNHPMDEMEDRIAELNGIYRKRISTDSTGRVNYEFEERLPSNISNDIKRQIEADIDNSTARGEKKTETNNKPKKPEAPKPDDDGIIIE